MATEGGIEVELDGKSDLLLSSCKEDLPKKVGGDCNGISHEVGIAGESKENSDDSYVLVEEDPVSAADRSESQEEEPVVEEKSISEMDLSSPSEVKGDEVDGEASKCEIEEGGEGAIEEKDQEKSMSETNLSSPCEEKRDEAEVEQKSNEAFSEETKHDVDVIVEGSKGEIEEGTKVENNCKVEEQDKLDSDDINESAGIIESRLNQPDGEEKVEEEKNDQVEVEQKHNETFSEIKHDVDVNVEGLKCEIEEGGGIVNNGTIEEQDKLGSDVVVEKTIEPINEGAGIVESGLNQPDEEEKAEEEMKLPEVVEAVEEEMKLQEVVEAVESDSHQLTHEEEKIGDQAKLDCESESKGSQELDSQTEATDFVESELVKAVGSNSHQPTQGEEEVEGQAKLDGDSESKDIQALDSQTEATDSVESELHQPYVAENKDEETSKHAASEEAEENQSSQLPGTGATESESVQIDSDEDIDGQSKLEPSAEVCQDTQITGIEAVETKPCQPDDVKECETGTLADEIAVEDPSTNHETENLQPEMASCPSDDLSAGPVARADLESEVVEISVGRDEITSTCSVDVKAENGLGNSSIEENQSIPAIPDHDLERETDVTIGFAGSTNLPVDPVDDSQSKSGTGNSSPSSKEEFSSTGTVKLESLLLNGSVVKGENKPDCVSDVKSNENEGDQSIVVNGESKPGLVSDVKSMENEEQSIVVNGESKPDCVNDVKSIENQGDQSICGDCNGKSVCEGDGIEGIHSNGGSSPSLEDPTIGALEGTKVDSEVEKRSFRFMIRIPRFIDDKIRAQIELTQKQVDEKTLDRDDIRSTIQSRRGICGEFRDKFEAARSEERAARDALHAKRREMDSVQSVMNRLKNAISIEDINERVRNMEHRIEHETVPLKEEKQLIREMKQLKHLREQLSSSLGQQAELQPTSDERVKIEARFKLLKQEMESCKKEVMRLEGISKAAWKIYSDENEKLKELQAQHRAADDLRQEAYTQLHNLRKQLYEKNKSFRMYKEDAKKAEDYAFARDRESVQRLCVNQVEMIMELWNKNDEFRNEYIRCNTMSTLRRLRTLDGRSLGPDEESPLLRKALDGRVDNSLVASSNKIDFPLLQTSERDGKSVGQDVRSAVHLEKKNPIADSKSVVNLEQKHPTVKSKTIIKPAGSENSRVTVSGREVKQENDEERRRTMEEEVLARKAEELRKEEEAAKLKEQRRLEEKVKAKEAEERKRRNAEKVQARAELRAQKEAELKEKEREKRARKKEKKKEKVEVATGGDEAESGSRPENNSQPENTQEHEIKEKPVSVVKRPQKPSLLAKQIKPKVVPPPLPLRNRGKKRMQQWMWILLVVVMVIALFLVGNIGFSFKFGLPSSSF